MALISFVRRPDGHWSYDGPVARIDQPAEVDLEPGTYTLLAQSMYEAECAVEQVRVVAGEDQRVDLHLRPARQLSLDLGVQARSTTGSGHYLVLQDGTPILVQGAGWGEPRLVLPDRDLELELHSPGCVSVSRAPLPRGVEFVQVP